MESGTACADDNATMTNQQRHNDDAMTTNMTIAKTTCEQQRQWPRLSGDLVVIVQDLFIDGVAGMCAKSFPAPRSIVFLGRQHGYLFPDAGIAN